jgi:hypothetical protein
MVVLVLVELELPDPESLVSSTGTGSLGQPPSTHEEQATAANR